jgi:pyrroline-5-carboxylate reductase
MNKTNLGVIGLGKIGEAIVTGLRAAELGKKFAIAGTTRSEESANLIAKKYKISCHTDNKKLVKESEILFLAVKPYQAKAVLEGVRSELRTDQVLVSLCASIMIQNLEEWTGKRCKLIRAMPNTPALVGEAMTVLCAQNGLSATTRQSVEDIFSTVGAHCVCGRTSYGRRDWP